MTTLNHKKSRVWWPAFCLFTIFALLASPVAVFAKTVPDLVVEYVKAVSPTKRRSL